MSVDSTSTPNSNDPALSLPALSWVWVRHLASFLIPLTTVAFLWTGPHPWYIAPLFMLPPILALSLDSNATIEQRQPLTSTPAWPFDLIVYALAAIQVLIIYLLAQMFSLQGFFSVDTAMIVLVVGGSSGFSIITAHELIHRTKPWERNFGRLVLATVLQEHFYTEHLRGHHVKVATEDDPATARFGEDYEAFYRRTVPGQFKSAWRLETKRLGDPEMSLFDRRMLGNRVIHGLALGWGIAVAIGVGFGWVSFLAFVLQALMASRLLEAVNYFEHWGLRRTTRRIRAIDSWDTHSWYTYYGLTGLSRHADHHRDPSRPFQQLQVFEEAPILPTGYIGMIDLVSGKVHEFKKYAVEELQRRELGPFSSETDPAEAAKAHEIAEQILAYEPKPPPGLFGPNAKGESGGLVVAKRVAIRLGIVLAITFGSQFESAGELSFTSRFVLNTWIIAAFVVMVTVFRRLLDRDLNASLSFAMALAVLVTIGTLTTRVTGL